MAMSIIPSLALFATCIATIAGATSPSPAPSAADCSAVLYQMMPCVDYITIGSTKANASKDCCKVVREVLISKGDCLCDAFKQSGRIGIQLNLTRSLGLPAACGISTSLPDCGIPLPPGMAPAPVPSTKAPTPAPRTAAPAPFPCTKPPTPAPSATAPTPVPITTSPTPAPSTTAPTPVPITTAPTPAPSTTSPTQAPSSTVPTPAPSTTAPTVAPVNPPAIAPKLAPSSGPTAAPPPSNDNMGPSGEDSLAPAESGAPSFTIFSNLIVLLLALLASFRAL